MLLDIASWENNVIYRVAPLNVLVRAMLNVIQYINHAKLL